MKKPAKGPAAVPLAHARGDDAFMAQYPLLSERMYVEAWEDGSARPTDTLFLFTESGRWKCMLKDRHAGMIAFYTAHSIQELFETIEGHLRADAVDWKVDRKPAGRGR
jgi:hypothetical protein